jgi:hypothetical protein
MSRQLVIDPKYDPARAKRIDGSTAIGPGITLAKFLGSRGSRTSFEALYNKSFTGAADRLEIARNLVPHAIAMQTVFDRTEFSEHRLIVSEGVYEPTPYFINGKVTNEGQQRDYAGETPTLRSINDFRRTGQAVVYQLIDKEGKTDHAKTFDLAVFWKDYIDFRLMFLDYDTYDPSGELTSQIVLVMPEMDETYTATYGKIIATTYNGELQARNELVEILPD